jgi:hypothetical protein
MRLEIRVSWTLLLLLPAPGTFHEVFSQERDHIAALASTAKAKGVTTIAVPWIVLSYPAEAMSLEDELGGGCSPSLVEITRKRSAVSEYGDRILTWNEALVQEAFGAKLPERL